MIKMIAGISQHNIQNVKISIENLWTYQEPGWSENNQLIKQTLRG